MYPPSALFEEGAMGQARLDLNPCFDPTTSLPKNLLGGYSLNSDASCIFVTGSEMRTPLHSDERHGFLLHIAGIKNFILFANEDSDADPSLLRQLLTIRDENGLHSDIYRRGSDGDFGIPALRKVPRFQGALKPGDALFIPQRWLHDIESLTPTISVSLRFGAWDAPNASPGADEGEKRRRRRER